MEDAKIKLGIVGHGFVGKAVDYAFTHELVDKFLVDPLYDTTIDNLVEYEPIMTFITAPTPMHDNGMVDASIVEDAVLKLITHTKVLLLLNQQLLPM